ncbi:glycosyltransferase [Nodularia spumigena]|uniref:Glycosyltransferase n=1 Tax=Nodularia spumigena UHCC 0060 TaxID=3110300 RepID=A0ABU5UVJ1_NODSP|nr:glycosyltransferase [Nodularia spumigena]MEA5527544.1 glycosyltransferase [Nodularia spumigena UHCC 0143]MEA5610325.1 glycosyltransferase [Nodularia spumigena UHCC 0060]MEA5613612.1 glycosyltransferase [Nodularia spumigena UHCC 0040]
MNSDKKITLFLPSLRGGGAERIMVYLANGFAQRGFAVDLVLVKAEGPYLPLVSAQVRVIDLNCPRVLASLPSLIRYLKTEKPHAILSTLDHANVIAIIARALTRGSQKIAVRVANNISTSKRHTKSIRARLTAGLVKYTYNWVDQVIAVSQGVAEDLVKSHNIPHNQVTTIYNPAITPQLLDKIQEPFKHPWFAPEKPPVILGVGRLTAQKDFTTLIRAFAHLNQRHSARLMILGEGEDRAKLESLVKTLDLEQQVSLPGFVDNPFPYMKQASVFVLSSCFEGMPNALLQAMACGTPVVSTDCPSGPREILEDGKWGQLVPVGDVEAMAEAILASLQGETQRPSREILESRFGLDTIVDQYLSILL